ncbi:MAG: hypothetical protein H7Y08_07455, partial [Rhizobiaceae bacterium]|nr:hypothetical protein [Rhizobiaceae bacterium]
MIASVAVCLTATDAITGAAAQDLHRSPADLESVPYDVAENAFTTGSTQPRLVWGGPVPPEPIPGEVPVYVPSPSAYPATPQPQPQFSRPAEAPPREPLYDPEPAAEEPWPVASPEPGTEPEPSRRAARPASGLEPIDEGGMASRRLYKPRDALSPESADPARLEDLDARMGIEDPLPPLDAPVAIDGDEGMAGYAAIPREDPWAG